MRWIPSCIIRSLSLPHLHRTPTHTLHITDLHSFPIGEEIPLEDTVDEPDIIFSPMSVAEPGTGQVQAGAAAQEATYTLVMLDPDAPSRENSQFRSFRHWVVSVMTFP